VAAAAGGICLLRDAAEARAQLHFRTTTARREALLAMKRFVRAAYLPFSKRLNRGLEFTFLRDAQGVIPCTGLLDIERWQPRC